MRQCSVPSIQAVACSLPANVYGQEEIASVCQSLFPDIAKNPRLRAMFGNSGVRTRSLAEPLPFYKERRSFSERNATYLKHALGLARSAILRALESGGAAAEDISHIFFVTTTGLLTPSLDAYLINEIPFSPSVKRSPLFGVGCAGGVVGVERASEYLESRPSELALVLSVELCSLSFLSQEPGLIQWLAASLFSDGAAAVLIAGDERARRPGPEILSCQSLLIPDSLDMMGWEFGEWGMRLLLSPDVPRVAREHLEPAAREFLAKNGLALGDIEWFLIHPGSSKVIQACADALGLGPELTALSREILAERGNMSSATVLHIIERSLSRARSGSYGLMVALGPGFSCEMALLKF